MAIIRRWLPCTGGHVLVQVPLYKVYTLFGLCRFLCTSLKQVVNRVQRLWMPEPSMYHLQQRTVFYCRPEKITGIQQKNKVLIIAYNNIQFQLVITTYPIGSLFLILPLLQNESKLKFAVTMIIIVIDLQLRVHIVQLCETTLLLEFRMQRLPDKRIQCLLHYGYLACGYAYF